MNHLLPSTNTSSSAPSTGSISRRHDLDALRAIAMLLGILLHGMLSFIPMPDAGWPVHDLRQSGGYGVGLALVHGFRMPLFFLLSGFFTAMLWRKRGLSALMIHRGKRIFLPLVLGTLTIVPVVWVISIGLSVIAPPPATQSELSDYWSAIRAGDVASLRESLQAGVDPDQRERQFGTTGLSIASAAGHLDVVRHLLDAGAGVNVRNRDGSIPLHLAAFYGRVDVAKRLVQSGARVTVRNRLGETPVELTESGWMRTAVAASLSGLVINQDVVAAGRNQIAAMLQERKENPTGSAQIALAQTDQPVGVAEPAGNQQLAGLVLLLMYFPAFHHLWFLWFLCWLVVAFAVYAKFSDWTSLTPSRWLIASPLCLLWLVPLTFVPQSMMGLLYPNFGPDTSAGLLPMPQILFYYAIFFFYGAWYFDVDDEQGRLGRWWPLTLVTALLIVFPVGLAMTTGEFSWTDDWIDSAWYRPLAVTLQVLYVWLMSFGLMGLFRRCFSGESKTMRYLSDSSYWLYLAHLPLIMVGQWVIRDWPLPGMLKLTAMVFLCSVLLLISYQLFVRYTPIGTLLNGPRKRSEPAVTARQPNPALSET